MKNTYEELEELRTQIRVIVEPLENKAMELQKILIQDEIEIRKEQFKNILGKVFYVEKRPFRGKNISLIKPLSCDDFENEYNSCNVMQIEVENYESKNVVIKFSYDTCRVDSIPKMEEATPDIFNKVKEIAEANLKQSLNNFLCIEK